VTLFPEVFHLNVNITLDALERLECSESVVNDAQRTRESKLDRALPDGSGVFRGLYAPSDY